MQKSPTEHTSKPKILQNKTMTSIRVAAAQINTTVGDIHGNSELISNAIQQAQKIGCDIIAFPELAITGYPPEDLLLSQPFIQANIDALHKITEKCQHIAAVIGMVDATQDNSGKIQNIYNAAAIVVNQRIAAIYHKNQLPNYGVFDELRYFTPGKTSQIININGINIGVNICEDIWIQPGTADYQGAAGAKIILTLNSSPYEIGKLQTRTKLVTSLAKRHEAFAVYTNQVGGQDELVFDGGSIFANPKGEIITTAPRFEENLIAVDIHIPYQPANTTNIANPHNKGQTPIHIETKPFKIPHKPKLTQQTNQELDTLDEIYSALVVGTRDYVAKTGFQKVAIALSGGIDSSIVACIAVDAIGNQNVIGVAMPSRYSSKGSITDAQELAKRLDIPLWQIPIEPAHQAFDNMLEPFFEGLQPNVAEENVQARIRGNVMMTIANKFGWLILTTGNKSEMATGYATLYGDMAGGFAVIKDIPKQIVYRLSEHRNTKKQDSPIPRAILQKPPSAELKADQTDQDTLPPYEILDRIITAYVEQGKSPEQIIRAEQKINRQSGTGADKHTIIKLLQMIDRNEYKRRQAPPGIKITGLAFGRDRRLPIASKWNHAP